MARGTLGAGNGSRGGPAESETQRESNAPTTRIARRQNNPAPLLAFFIIVVMKIILQE
jgi:hypothetical protein